MKEKNLFSGIHAVLYALFRTDETIDAEAMSRQVDYCIAAGCHGITVLGLATEVQKLSYNERKQLIKEVSSAIRGRVPFSVTIAGNSVAEQVALTDWAKQHGADWLILQPPTAGNFAADVYLDFFKRVANSTTLPVAIQNAPQYLGRALSAEDIATLRKQCDNLVSVKSEDTALGVQHIIEVTRKQMHILGGRGGLEMTDNLRAGCTGFVLAPDIVPVAVKIMDAWSDRQFEQAETLYTQALPAITFVMQSLEHLITYGKRLYGIQSDTVIYDREPCLNHSDYGLKMTEHWAKQLARLNTK